VPADRSETGLRIREVAERLGVHRNTVANMLTDGRLRAIEVGYSAIHYRPWRAVDPASVEQLRRAAPNSKGRKWEIADAR
jgi:excisionase family DNA binding protein